MKTKTVCFSGHRKIPQEQLFEITQRLEYEIIHLIEQGYVYFGTGGALGFDTIAANTILRLKKKYLNIFLILVLPCLSQTKNWSNHDVHIYEEIKASADKVVYVSKEYTRECMFKRNRHLVDNSSVCVCYLKSDVGGTAYTVRYAKKKKLRIINVASPL